MYWVVCYKSEANGSPNLEPARSLVNQRAWSLVSGGAVPACLARPVARLLDILQDRVRDAAQQLESCNQLTRAGDGMGRDRQVPSTRCHDATERTSGTPKRNFYPAALGQSGLGVPKISVLEEMVFV